MTMELFKSVYQCLIPRALQNSPSRREWQLHFYFSSNPKYMLSDPPPETPKDWTAQLDLVTSDLPGLMHDGLYLTQENVQVLENHVQRVYSDERKCYFLRRCFTVVDPKWSGKLWVVSWNYEPVRDFRIHDLSADKVYNTQVLNKAGYAVYFYNRSKPEKSANYIYDDMPMKGLWPFPRKEEGKGQEVLKREGEDGDQGGEEERKGTEEGEEVVKEEGVSEEEEKDTEEEEEGLDGFSEWECEDSLIDSWRD
ncbi:hypothetical protein CEP54_012422 [Fusarium duplospermum]|uniref:Uncharacterized protein n=1 Tax=Fusarium duplospermum TaxID=1325734 RepID=A0A428P8Y9_9HYPO|nr:hypothetical protein CEP54_012422 [Fusarium duplospermum]